MNANRPKGPNISDLHDQALAAILRLAFEHKRQGAALAHGGHLRRHLAGGGGGGAPQGGADSIASGGPGFSGSNDVGPAALPAEATETSLTDTGTGPTNPAGTTVGGLLGADNAVTGGHGFAGTGVQGPPALPAETPETSLSVAPPAAEAPPPSPEAPPPAPEPAQAIPGLLGLDTSTMPSEDPATNPTDDPGMGHSPMNQVAAEAGRPGFPSGLSVAPMGVAVANAVKAAETDLARHDEMENEKGVELNPEETEAMGPAATGAALGAAQDPASSTTEGAVAPGNATEGVGGAGAEDPAEAEGAGSTTDAAGVDAAAAAAADTSGATDAPADWKGGPVGRHQDDIHDLMRRLIDAYERHGHAERMGRR